MNNFSTEPFNYSICLVVHELSSITEFFTCLKYLLPSQPLVTTIYSICLIIGSFVLNLSLLFLLWTKTEVTVFDKIIFSHACIDFLMCFIDYPFMVLPVYFNYWPFSQSMCIAWIAYDNGLSSLEILTFLLMSWMRIRCILAPRSYLNDLIVKHVYKFIIPMWLVILTLWSCASTFMLLKNFDQSFCNIVFDLESISISVLIVCFLGPLCLVVVATIFIDIVIFKKKMALRYATNSDTSDRNQPNGTRSSNVLTRKATITRFFKVSPQLKLTIIIAVFCIQYMPYYITWLTSILCPDCVSMDLYNVLSLLAYFPSIVNPVVMLTLNKNLFKRFKCFNN